MREGCSGCLADSKQCPTEFSCFSIAQSGFQKKRSYWRLSPVQRPGVWSCSMNMRIALTLESMSSTMWTINASRHLGRLGEPYSRMP